MKKKVLLALSYVAVAMLATVITLATAPRYALRTDKLSQLEALIEEKYKHHLLPPRSAHLWQALF